MTDSDAREQEKAFRAVLYPHRSLPRAGFVALMASIGVVSFIAGVGFYRLGAWPVPGFFGLDVLLIYVAFRLNYRSGCRYEVIDLTHDKLEVTRVAPSGKRESFSLSPYWARVRLTERVEGRSDLALAAHGREYRIGDFLSEDERREFAGTLEGALLAARTPKFT